MGEYVLLVAKLSVFSDLYSNFKKFSKIEILEFYTVFDKILF